MFAWLDTMAFIAKMKVENFFENEEGDVNVVSIVVLIGIAVLLAVLFRTQITELLTKLFETLNKNAIDAVSK